MGKDKAHRTKNNARPSNSGRSAQLLESSSFVGFPSLTEGSSFPIPVLPGLGLAGLQLDDGESQSLNPQLQLAMKKMNKKDAITRLKALQEFGELCQNVEAEEQRTVLHFWPRMFSALATDPDHRVREATQRAHNQLAKRAGRNLAPHLRSLAGPWFVAQFDTFAPAASAASQAFQDAFPGAKFPEAVKFCQKEILSHVSENLLSQTVETLAYQKSLPAEEVEARLERVLSSNLQAYCLYLRKIPHSELKLAEESNKALVTSPKFWKLSKHKTPLVRRAWFMVIATLLQEAPFLVEEHGAHVVPAVFGNLDEADPCVLPAVWEAALHSLVTIKDCWSHVNPEKVVFPKLWHILRDGGQGNAAAIFPNLLPLLSNIVPNDKAVFHSKFFSNMRIGLSQKTVLHSCTESSAIITAYIECFRFIVSKEQEQNENYAKQLLEEQLFPLFASCLVDRKFHHTLGPLATQISDMLQNWCSASSYDPLLDHFWLNLTSICMQLSEPPTQEGVYQSLTDFIVLLLNPSKVKKSRKVNFSIEEGDEEKVKQAIETPFNPEYYRPLEVLAQLTSQHVLKICQQVNYPELYINMLLKTIKAFNSKEFFESLSGNCFNFYTDCLKPWTFNPEKCFKSVVELTFILLEHLQLEEKQKIFANFCKIEKRSVMQQCLAESINAAQKGDESCLQWLRSPELSSLLVSLAQEVSNVLNDADIDSSSTWSILKLCFSSTSDGGDLVISSETVSSILRVLCNALTISSPSKLQETAALDSCAFFVGELSNSLFGQKLKLCQATVKELILATFKLCCGGKGLSSNAKESLQKAWMKGINFIELSPAEMRELCEKFSKIAHENFSFANNQGVLCSSQLLSITKDPSLVNIFLEPPEKWLEWQKQIEDAVIISNLVSNSVFCLNESIPEITSLDCLFSYINVLSFNVNLLLELYKLSVDPLEAGEMFNVILTSEELAHIVHVVYAVSLCGRLNRSYKNNASCYKTTVDYNSLRRQLSSLMSGLSSTQRQNILNFTLQKAQSNSFSWGLAVVLLLETYPDLSESVLTELMPQTPEEPLEKWKLALIEKLFLPSSTAFSWENLPLNKVLTESTTKRLMTEENPLCAIYVLYGTQTVVGENVTKIFDLFVKWRQQNKWKTVFKGDVAETSELLGLLKLVRQIVEVDCCRLTPRHWDSLLCSLAVWMQEAKDCLLDSSLQPNPWHAALLVSICRVICQVQRTMDELKENEELRTKIPKHLLDEWRSLFVPELYSILMTFFYAALDTEVFPIWEELKLQEIGACIIRAPTDWLIVHEPPKRLTNSHKRTTVQDRNIEDLLIILFPLLHSSSRSIQVTSYYLLKKLAPKLAEKDEQYRLGEDSDSLDLEKLSSHLFGLEMSSTQIVVDTMLMDFRLGDCCIVEPFTDSHTYTQAYLLTWGVVLDLCKEAKSELRYHYARWLSNGDYLKNMLQIVFRLMPDYVVQPFESRAANTTAWKNFSYFFMVNYGPKLEEGCHTAAGVQQAACYIYRRSLQHLPALVRQWWNDVDTRTSGLVNCVTSSLVSPFVCAAEMDVVKSHEKNFSNMEVKVHQVAREVVAVYTVDDVRMELTITLPPNHPLGSVKVESNKPAIDLAKWKQWVMQLTMFLTHQNGSIWDGLLLWKRNLDNKFEGVEECYICFSILHGTNYQIPKLSCHTCHKKFHSSCLYRWFHTSNNSTCPICRNLF